MSQQKLNIRFLTLTLFVLLAALSRVLPHLPNFTPLAAIALFGGAYFSSRFLSFLIPVLSLWISDLVLNNFIYQSNSFVWFYSGFYWVYGSFLLIVCLGLYFQKSISLLSLIGLSLSSSILFFLITNFGVWLGSSIYPQTLSGLTMCYVAGLPFFTNTVLGDLFYCAVLFGLFELAKSQFRILSLSK
jgi:hypothetical protein